MKTITVTVDKQIKEKVNIELPAYFKFQLGEDLITVYRALREDMVDRISLRTPWGNIPSYEQSHLSHAVDNEPANEEDWNKAVENLKQHVSTL